MAGPIRDLTIHIESSRTARGLTVKSVANVLNQLQTTIYHIGDSIAGGDFRVRGPPQEEIREKCDLVFQDLKKGSFQAVLALEERPDRLPGFLALGEDALQRFCNMMNIIESSDSISESRQAIMEIIKDPLHRTRILNDFDQLWPEDGRGYSLKIQTSGERQVTLHSSKKFYIEELLEREGGQKGIVAVRGVLLVMSTRTKKETTQIIGPDGTISIHAENVDIAKRHWKKPIIAYGRAMFNAAGNVAELLTVNKIEPFSETTINHIYADKGELQLSQPLPVEVDWQHRHWMMRHKGLNIAATAKDYDECLKEFYNQFFFVWRQYGLADDSSLSSGARELKSNIVSMVKEYPHF